MFRHVWNRRIWFTAVVCFVAALPATSSAQYFGENKVRYESFDFKVLHTPHFEIHYYDEEKEAAENFARMAERWYSRLSKVLSHELTPGQPIILYASGTAFRGTTAIPGYIGEGTGGVTEGLRRRLVMPLAGPLAETDHVLGHELVHAFQFDIAARTPGPEGGLTGAFQLPLWFVEGMAEYLSLGPVDPQTAMWLRDAVLREDIPAIEKLDSPRYFPYRYGHAFWAFVGGKFGDEAIVKIFRRAVRGDERKAISDILETSLETLSSEWRAELMSTYEPAIRTALSPDSLGRAIAGSFKGDPGDSLNVAPVLSPDGKLMVYFSTKDLFSVDLFLADASTGKTLDKLTKTATDAHFDSLGFVSSAGAWSSDGTRFAFAGVSNGRPELEIYNVEQRKVESRTKLGTLGEIFSLTWSPDGRQIALSAISHGVTDLFVFNRETGETRQLTNDLFADLQPAWSPDGRRIAFVTDRFASNPSELSFGGYGLALIDPSTSDIARVRVFEQGKHTNPQWSTDGGSLYFIADPDGASNVYRVSPDGRDLRRVTNLQTGVSGITSLSPALSVAARENVLVFSAFSNGNYAIYRMEGAGLGGSPSTNLVSSAIAGTLPPLNRARGVVSSFLESPATGLASSADFTSTPYRPRLALDAVAATQIGAGIGGFGSYIGGGTAFQWSDLLGYHNLTTILQTTFTTSGGGFLNNFSAVGIYENQRTRWNWGVMGGQVPLTGSSFSESIDTINGEPAWISQSIQYWQIDRELLGTFAFPFNRAKRVEFLGGFQNISYRAEVSTIAVSLNSGRLLLDEQEKLPSSPALRMARTGAALVHDTSVFTGTSPTVGERYRLEYGLSAGTLTYSTALADYRRYIQIARPLTLAGRVMHFGRYGSGAEDSRQQDLFLGYSSLVRGYTENSFTVDDCGNGTNATGTCPGFDRLLGSRLAVANAELRVPLLGVLGVIPSRSMLPVEASLFYDAGVAWTSAEKPTIFGGSRKPVTSWGGSLRINLLGFAIGQLSYVHPNSRAVKDWRWEFSFTPGF